jgi:hypothetical protein
MNNLGRVIDNVYDFLDQQTEDVKADTKELLYDIKEEADCLFLYEHLDRVDVDIFIMNYVKYMKYRYNELPKIWCLQKFFDLRKNILQTAELMDHPGIAFCINNDHTRKGFFKGFLLHDTKRV